MDFPESCLGHGLLAAVDVTKAAPTLLGLCHVLLTVGKNTLFQDNACGPITGMTVLIISEGLHFSNISF